MVVAWNRLAHGLAERTETVILLTSGRGGLRLIDPSDPGITDRTNGEAVLQQLIQLIEEAHELKRLIESTIPPRLA